MTHAPPRRLRAPLLLIALMLALVAAVHPSDAAAKRKPSCTRGGATLEAADGATRVVRAKGKLRGGETRHENLYACWAKTGRRVKVAEELDFGADSRTDSSVEIVQGRYVGVMLNQMGGQTERITARIYDARTGRLLHTSKTCDAIQRGDRSGVDDVAFLEGGGMAMACDRLLLYRTAGAPLELIEPEGTAVWQLAVTRHSLNSVPRLFWAVSDGAGGFVARSMLLLPRVSGD
jgi:hypothetical protein